MNKFNLDDEVTVIGKNVSGKIAYVGKTHFSGGEWFGVILNEPKGRNNGSVDGERYFRCSRNYGIFTRACQLEKVNTRERNLNPPKAVYPNYLVNSLKSKATKLQSKKEAKTEMKTKKDPNLEAHPMYDIIKDLEKNLKIKAEELSEAKQQKANVEDKLNTLEGEFQKASKRLENLVAAEKNYIKELVIAQKQVNELKKILNNTEKELEISERGRRQLEMSTEELRDITEYAVIEKEITDEKCEHLECLLNEECEKNKNFEIELEIMKEEMQLQHINGVPAVHYVKNLENENKVLKSALQRLKELYNVLQQHFSDYKEMAVRNTIEIKSLKDQERKLSKIISKYEEDASELYETIDSMMSADEIVLEVTDRNFNFERKIIDLHQTLQFTEDQLEISEEVEETLQEIKSICGEEIECLESKLKSTQIASDKKVIMLEMRDEVIVKYRELTKSLRDENCKFAEELEKALKEREAFVSAAENSKLTIDHNNNKNMTNLVEAEILKIELENAREKVDYWTPFLQDNFFERGGENFAIEVKLYVSKILRKLNLLTQQLQFLLCKFYNKMNLKDLRYLTMRIKFLTFIYVLWRLFKMYSKSLDGVDGDHFLTLGKHYDIMKQKNMEIDSYLALLCKGEIDRKYSLVNLSNTCHTLSQGFDFKFVDKFQETIINLEYNLNMLQISCKCIIADCSAVDSLNGLSTAYKLKTKHVSEVTERLTVNVCFILNCIKTCEKENMFLNPLVADCVKENSKSVQDIMNYILSVYEKIADDDNETDFYARAQDSQSLSEIISKLDKANLDLQDLRKALENGQFFVEHKIEFSKFSAVHARAQHRKREKEEMKTNFQTKITSCELEIINLTQKLQKQKAHDNSFNNPALQYLQQETSKPVDSKELLCAGDCITRTVFLKSKLHDMECSIKYLVQRNFELKVSRLNEQHKNLIPWEIFPKPKYHPDVHIIVTMQKRLNKVASKLRGIIVPLVADVTTKNANNERNYKRYLVERMLVRKEVEEEMWNIFTEIKRMRSSPRHKFGLPQNHSLTKE